MSTDSTTYTGFIVREEGDETLVVMRRPDRDVLALVSTQLLKDSGISAGFTVSTTFNSAGQAIEERFTPNEDVESDPADYPKLKAVEVPLRRLP